MTRPMTRIAILDDYSNAAKTAADWASLEGAEITSISPSLLETDADKIAALAPFDVIVAMRERTPFPAEYFAQLPALKLLVTTGMRNLAIDMVAARAHEVDVCGTQMTPYAAYEHTWALLMALAKRIPAEAQAMTSGGWQAHTGVGLSGKNLGILGLGKIGSKIAKIAATFDMNIIAWSPNLSKQRADECGATRVDKKTLFAKSDFLTIHMVLSDTTHGLVDKAALAEMKTSAFLVNTSRGALVDESALIDCLKNKQIAGAALDVFDVEPLPRNHALRDLDNVILTGHTGYVIEEMLGLAYGQAVENINSWLAGSSQRLLNP